LFFGAIHSESELGGDSSRGGGSEPTSTVRHRHRCHGRAHGNIRPVAAVGRSSSSSSAAAASSFPPPNRRPCCGGGAEGAILSRRSDLRVAGWEGAVHGRNKTPSGLRRRRRPVRSLNDGRHIPRRRAHVRVWHFLVSRRKGRCRRFVRLTLRCPRRAPSPLETRRPTGLLIYYYGSKTNSFRQKTGGGGDNIVMDKR